MDGPEFVFAVTAILAIFVGLPWMVFHYVTKWKQSPKITVEDEQLLDDMFNLARRLEERLITVERIAAADHPDWRPGMTAPQDQPRLGRDAPATPYTPPYTMDRRN